MTRKNQHKDQVPLHTPGKLKGMDKELGIKWIVDEDTAHEGVTDMDVYKEWVAGTHTMMMIHHGAWKLTIPQLNRPNGSVVDCQLAY